MHTFFNGAGGANATNLNFIALATIKFVEKRRMCPNCRAFIEINDRVCPYCGTQLGPRAIDLRGSQIAASFMPRANLTSSVILIVNALFYLIELLLSSQGTGGRGFSFGEVSGRAIVLLGCKYGPLIAAGQWWRLITAGFLHGSFIHIAMNSYALFILVTEVEQFYGTSRLVVAYVFSTFTGFLVSFLWSPGAPSLGASAAAYGLIGIMLAMSIGRRSDPLVQLVRTQYTQWLIFGLLLSLVGNIDLAAHLGGFAGGFLLGVVAGLPGIPRSRREVTWNVLAGLAIAVTIYAFYLDSLSFRMLSREL
ncbi:MAG: rhomboid family intramembrane serine protease [Acidobacteriaceae bacterium]|nr:rhomboid family intramembrane serine protease [Acidobacteriaceae bacterium]